MINDIVDARIQTAVAEVAALGGEALGIKADVSKSTEVKAMFAKAVVCFSPAKLGSMDHSHIRSAVLFNFAQIAAAAGLDPQLQLQRAQLDAQCLNDPDLKIPVTRVLKLLETAAQASGVEDFGLRMAMSRGFSNLGVIAIAARAEATVREALYCVQRTLPLHNEALRLDIDESGPVVVIRERILARLQGPIRQGIELTTGVLYRMLKEMLGDSWSPMAICFMHQAPRDLTPYRRAFGGIVQFNSVLNGLTCRHSDLDRPMPGADPQLLRTVRQYLDATANYQPTHASRTTHLILGLLPSGRCTAELVARYVGVDRRTLQRWLESEGTSFSMLVEAVRSEAALRCLANPRQTVTDLAAMLGFSDISAFSRWFSVKFGMSPRQWRSQMQPGHQMR